MSDADGFPALDDWFARHLPELAIEWQPAAVPAPSLVVLNGALAASLGLSPEELRLPAAVAVFAGNAVPTGARPVAMGYAGHQFGNYSPRLGDGRALLLGEFTAADGKVRDLHLKGSGRTPFARGGDGKAALGPMLREYLISEALHALGVPTTRSLAVAATGERIMRDTGPLPGAVLARVAASHLRVGMFEYAARLPAEGVVQRLADHAITRHHPAAASEEQPYLALLAAVAEAQASLIAQWMSLGFIHGVMNTDNMTISGESIDFGPCAFMDRYDPRTVFSSIDSGGRYAYGRQPGIAQWNLARLAESLLSLIADESSLAVELAMAELERFPERFQSHWEAQMRAKLGLLTSLDGDRALFDTLHTAMSAAGADFTGTFRELASVLRGGVAADGFFDGDWLAQWQARLAVEGREAGVVADAMDAVNPRYIPRNHHVELALTLASDGDLAPFELLLHVVTNPFVVRPEWEAFEGPAPDAFAATHRTFCGT
ncbi:MAG: protein adenylyltransferase SelO [Ilumatobacteraceae bacterium]